MQKPLSGATPLQPESREVSAKCEDCPSPIFHFLYKINLMLSYCLLLPAGWLKLMMVTFCMCKCMSSTEIIG